MRPNDTAPDGAAFIPLRARDGSVRAYAVVDAADAEWVSQWRWSLATGYAARSQNLPGVGPRNTYLHRELLGLTRGDGLERDHIDPNRLNCRRSNLRAVTKQGNRQNVPNRGMSRYRGVYWDKSIGYWRAVVEANGKRHYLGVFKSEDAAGQAAQDGRMKLLECAVD